MKYADRSMYTHNNTIHNSEDFFAYEISSTDLDDESFSRDITCDDISEQLKEIGRSLSAEFSVNKRRYQEVFRRMLYAQSTVDAAKDINSVSDMQVLIQRAILFLNTCSFHSTGNFLREETIQLNKNKLLTLEQDIENFIHNE